MQSKLNQFRFEPRCNFGVAIAGVAIAAGGLALGVAQATKKQPSTGPSNKALLAADDAKIAALQAQLAGTPPANTGSDLMPIVLVGGLAAGGLVLVLAMSKK